MFPEFGPDTAGVDIDPTSVLSVVVVEAAVPTERLVAVIVPAVILPLARRSTVPAEMLLGITSELAAEMEMVLLGLTLWFGSVTVTVPVEK